MRISDWSSDVCSSDLCCQKTVRLEDAFIDLAFEQGPVPGMTPKEIKRYIRYIADWRLGQLGFQPIYMIDEHPLPWLAPLLNGVEHANFFETRAPEYSKAATRGDWNTVWTSRPEHTSELQSLMRISYAVFRLKKKNNQTNE